MQHWSLETEPGAGPHASPVVYRPTKHIKQPSLPTLVHNGTRGGEREVKGHSTLWLCGVKLVWTSPKSGR